MRWDADNGEWIDDEEIYAPEPEQGPMYYDEAPSSSQVAGPPGGPEGGAEVGPDINAEWQEKSLPDRYPSAPNPNGLDDWARRGVDPATEIFDQNGQIRPGWRRTAGGYERVAPPRTTTGGPSFSGDTGRVPGTTEYPIAGGATSFSYPDWVPPDIQFNEWNAPSWDVSPFDYPDFDYAEFEGPTAENFTADPGYDFRRKEMLRGITNQKSAQGLLATGGTLTDLMSYAGGLASQEFGNVWNRDFTKHNANKDAAFGEWQANRGNQSDIWGKNYQSEADEFTRGLTTYLTQEEKKAQDWNRSLTGYTTNMNKEAMGYGLNLDTSQLNLARDNSQFSNLLSLYNIMTRTLPTYTPSV